MGFYVGKGAIALGLSDCHGGHDEVLCRDRGGVFLHGGVALGRQRLHTFVVERGKNVVAIHSVPLVSVVGRRRW